MSGLSKGFEFRTDTQKSRAMMRLDYVLKIET